MPSSQIEHFVATYREWTLNHINNYSRRYTYLVEILTKNEIKTYVDLGANTGGVCQALLERLPTLEKAYLFEPQIDNYNFMVELFRENEKVSIQQRGIYYGVDEIALNRCDDNVGGYTIIQDPGFNPTGDIMKCSMLEDFDLGKVDFIKIDVEGSEINIIKNSTSLRNIDYIEIELHPPYLNRAEDFIEEYIVGKFPEHEVVTISKLSGVYAVDDSNIFLKKKSIQWS